MRLSTLRWKKAILLSVIIGILIISGLGTFAALRMAQGTFRNTLTHELKAKTKLHELRVEMIKMNRNELDYIQTGDDSFIELHEENLLKIKEHFQILQKHPINQRFLEKLKDFESSLDKYQDSFDALSSFVAEEREPRRGLRAQFHRHHGRLDRLRDGLKGPSYAYTENIERIRQQGLAYVNGNRQKDFERLQSLHEQGLAMLPDVPLPLRSDLQFWLDAYEQMFTRLHEIREESAILRDELDQDFSSAEESIFQCSTLIDKSILQRERYVAQIINWMSGGVILLMLGAGLLIRYLSRMISAMITQIRHLQDEDAERQTKLNMLKLESIHDEDLPADVQNIFKVVRQLIHHDGETAQSLFQDLFQQVKPFAKELGKETPNLEMNLPDVLFHSEAIAAIRQSWVHLFRNTLDHGFESVMERKTLNKPPRGTISIAGRIQNEILEITMEDDGRGLALDRIREQGLRLGLIKVDEVLTDDIISELIFTSGFSTRENCDHLSGRGIGMDAIKHILEGAGARVQLQLLPKQDKTPQYAAFRLVVSFPISCWSAHADLGLLKSA